MNGSWFKGKRVLWIPALIIVVGLLMTTSLLSQQTLELSQAPAEGVTEASASANPDEITPRQWLIWSVTAPLGAVLALVFAYVLYRGVMRNEEGTDRMKEIAGHVRQGANAYLRSQYIVVTVFFVIIAGLLALMAFKLQTQSRIMPVAFLSGGIFSALCGWIGMKTATHASARTAHAARTSLNGALQVAFRSGAVMGLVVVGFGLLNSCLWFLILRFYSTYSLREIAVTMLSFGIGASLQALFARVGGGIFTKAADVGADLVGKVEAGIPEDDPRNPATIADNVGDNVGDVAGMGADLFESYCASMLAASALGVTAGLGFAGLAAPMVIAGVGIILSILGVYLVRSGEDATQHKLLAALNRGIWGSAVLILAASAGIMVLLFSGTLGLPGALKLWGSIASGLIAGIIIGRATEYYTADSYKPTQDVAEQSKTGPATVIIEGYAVGMRSTWIPVLAVCAAIIVSYGLAGGFSGGPKAMNMGLFGVGIAAVGMLSTLGITLATDAYGPIADNAGGNAEMSGLPPEVRERTDALDALGNTTAATGKGFAIGSAALTALALLAAYTGEVRVSLDREAAAYIEANLAETADMAPGKAVYLGHGKFAKSENVDGEVKTTAMLALSDVAEDLKVGDQTDTAGLVGVQDASLPQFVEFYDVGLLNPRVIAGLMIGAMLSFLFASMTMRAVGRAAGKMVEEVRRQFREIPGIMEGTGTPDYASCVKISTHSAQREMVAPSLMAIAVPVLAGLVLGVAGVMGVLAGGLVCGFVLAVSMANAGGSWDNAKKYIERGNLGGKGSDCHKAAVVGDTVGDPFKDTSGPSLNILIKLMSMVSVVAAGVVVRYSDIVFDFIKRLLS